MKRATYYDINTKKYVLLEDSQDVLYALGKLEDFFEKREPKSFAEYISNFRKWHNVSQDSFATALRVKPITVKNIETGTNLPSYPIFQAMSNVYHTPISELQFAFRRYAFHLQDEALDYMISRQDDDLVEPFIYKHIGTLIQCERRFLSLSKEKLAEYANTSVYLISKIEKGEQDISYPMLRKFGDFLNSERLIEVSKKLNDRLLRKERRL